MNIQRLKLTFLVIFLLNATYSYAGYVRHVEKVDGLSSSSSCVTTFAHGWMPCAVSYKPSSDHITSKGYGIKKLALLKRSKGKRFSFSNKKPRWSFNPDQGSLKKITKLEKFKRLDLSPFSVYLRKNYRYFFPDQARQEGPKTPGEGSSISVPEPSSLALLAVGLVGLGLCRRKNRLG